MSRPLAEWMWTKEHLGPLTAFVVHLLPLGILINLFVCLFFWVNWLVRLLRWKQWWSMGTQGM